MNRIFFLATFLFALDQHATSAAADPKFVCYPVYSAANAKDKSLELGVVDPKSALALQIDPKATLLKKFTADDFKITTMDTASGKISSKAAKGFRGYLETSLEFKRNKKGQMLGVDLTFSYLTLRKSGAYKPVESETAQIQIPDLPSVDVKTEVPKIVSLLSLSKNAANSPIFTVNCGWVTP